MAIGSTVVIIPTFNEVENLRRLLPQIFELPVDILIVDDASKDGTPNLVRESQKNNSRLAMLERPQKMGLGSAYRDGFKWALDHGYTAIIQMDADGSHRVSDLKEMLRLFNSQGSVELVIGSRWIQGGAVRNWPKHRELLSRSANLYSRVLLGLTIKDSTAGFRIYSSDLLRKMNLQGIGSEGYAFQIEMTREADRVGAQIVEVPIVFVEREFGVSKMSGAIVLEALLRVTTWGLARLIGR